MYRFIPVIALLLIPSLLHAETPPAKKPNVLLIVSDDLGARLGCYGDPLMKSPNLDKLAARGVRFANAYCQFPLCNPSRASFLTGLRPDTLKVYENATQFRKNIPDAQSVGQTFQKAGYDVARVGKLYHYGVPAQIGTDGLDDEPTWNRRFNPAGRDVKEDKDKVLRTEYDPMEKKTIVKDKNELNQTGGTLSWLASEGSDGEHTDGKIADKAIELLAAAGDKPFFLAIGFFRPHTPYVAPKVPYFGFYPQDKVPVWVEPAGWRDTVPKIALNLKPDQEHMTEAQKREAVQAYYASTSFMDAQAGRVLDKLDELKLTDNTIVVFISDHGYQLGEHAQWQKMCLFELSARVPMIIAAPGGAKGAVSTRPVELVDLHATLADLAGVAAPKTDGTSLRPLVKDPAAAWDKPAITQVTRGGGAGRNNAKAESKRVMGYSVRTEQYRYTQWGASGAELYDHAADPAEMKNLAADPKYAAVVAKLKALLPPTN
ncbi:sulfatase [Humisphaera borealis]|uniref:Sulfatase n=1 Tax=Humisphaera borealis TaxID=2807512 RepID=A0A7M2WZC6_9BACT|nr:sulfatase [Humisphaera borealis]QOV90789.1 sulfatase [Humisphaera borealis]